MKDTCAVSHVRVPGQGEIRKSTCPGFDPSRDSAHQEPPSAKSAIPARITKPVLFSLSGGTCALCCVAGAFAAVPALAVAAAGCRDARGLPSESAIQSLHARIVESNRSSSFFRASRRAWGMRGVRGQGLLVVGTSTNRDQKNQKDGTIEAATPDRIGKLGGLAPSRSP